MCTISFLPGPSGFFLAMNRDEQKTRPRALAPRKRRNGGHVSLYPSERNGGAWIGINDTGLALALINWYAKPQRDRDLCLSRGIIIPALLVAHDVAGASKALGALPLPRLNPFRLIVMSFREKRIVEWRWDGARLTTRRHDWRRGHWFSSGFDEALVNRKRAVLADGLAEATAAIRKLHRGHAPERGPLSVCMHRDVAETVSYTEIAVTAKSARLRYAAGAPCRKKLGPPRLLSFASETARKSQPR